jgi:HNH endonuclease
MSRPRILDLPHGHRCIIDEADWPIVKNLTLYRGVNGYVYFSTWENGASRPRTLHGLLMQAPKGMHVDHVNGDPLDNRRANLRVVTPSINQVNRKSLNRNNTSGVRGVAMLGEKWRAQIMVNGKAHHLGMFESLDDAVDARRAAEIRLFGVSCP